MPRPSKPIKRSILETRDLDDSETTSTKNKKRNYDNPFFKLILPPDLLKDTENSSENTSLRRNLNQSTKINSVKGLSAIEILSSSSEEDFFHHSSSTKVKCSFPTKTLSSAEDNKKSFLEEISSLANSNKLSLEQNLSTPKNHKNKIVSIKQEQKEFEMNSEDSDGDPFGFRRAEKKIMKKKGQSKISDDSEEVTSIDKNSQYNDNIQSEMLCQSISLNKGTNKNDINGSGDLFERKQESKKHNASIEDEKDDNHQVDNNNDQPIHDEDYLSKEIDNLGMIPIEILGDKNEKEEKKMPNATPSKVRKTPKITKTVDLVSLLPPRRRQLERASKNKIVSYNDTQFDEELVFLDEEKRCSDHEEGKTRRKRKVGKMQGEKDEKNEKMKPKKIKKETFIWELEELDEKTKQERAERIRRTEEIDGFVLVEEVVD
ncbi:hypothetical protein C1645_816651 [Glomus cerebriforme]|uniref:Uncharacterized protein n=1 Tax=Glomus cerebriforme TaxID=658196 RepID=A0A397TK85_9GLOM|nr:hypothetical protein C1645_816651 [Glomus cerebriforme]